MRLDRASRVLTTWIASLAILMAALAPAISQAMGAQGGKSWVEVCTTLGSKWLQADPSGDDAPAPPDASVFDHCAYCPLQAHALSLAALPVAPALRIDLRHRAPAAFLAALRTLHAWVSAQPRAPPTLS